MKICILVTVIKSRLTTRETGRGQGDREGRKEGGIEPIIALQQYLGMDATVSRGL